MTEKSFLSARVPQLLKNDFKAEAAQQGTNVQDLLETVVREYLKQRSKTVPNRDKIIKSLNELQSELRKVGIAHLYLFGSVARNKANSDSDIDVAADFGAKTPSLIEMGRIEDDIRLAVDGHKVDLVPLRLMRKEVAQESKADFVQVF